MADDDEDDGGGAGWLVSYADLMTLLFAAFVVLYGLKPEGQSDTVLGVTSSIRESFIEVPDFIPEDERKGPIKKGKFAYKFFKGDATTPPYIKKFRRSKFVEDMVDDDLEKMKSFVQEVNGKKKPRTRHIDPLISVERDENGIRLRILTKALYDPGEYRIKRGVQAKIQRLGTQLTTMRKPIHIEGHTDNSPPSGDLSNWELSALRATYMARFLIDRSNFPPDMITAGGMSDKKPIGDNTTVEGRMLNRRVEIKIRYR